MLFETRHLRLVAAIHEHGTITRAGLHLHLTQSALSHQLAALEQRVGGPLFHRLGKRMVATPAGLRLVATAERTLVRLQRAEHDVKRLVQGEHALLRLATECYTCYHWLPPVLLSFAATFPSVEVRIVAEATRRPLQALVQGKIDLGIVSGPHADSRLTFVPLFTDELVVVVPPDHRLAAQRFVSATDFAREHLIAYTVPKDEDSVLRQVLAPAGITPRRLTKVQLTEAIVELVKADMGISVLARWAIAPHVAAGTLVALPLTRRGFRRHWRAAVVRHDPLPAYLREFTRLLAVSPLTNHAPDT